MGSILFRQLMDLLTADHGLNVTYATLSGNSDTIDIHATDGDMRITLFAKLERCDEDALE